VEGWEVEGAYGGLGLAGSTALRLSKEGSVFLVLRACRRDTIRSQKVSANGIE
jgi:hypothetical protein